MKIDEMIAVLQAAKEGKRIQRHAKWIDDEGWQDHRDPGSMFNFISCNYRVKPEPREWWLCDGFDHERWIVVPPEHGTFCKGEKVKVREVLE